MVSICAPKMYIVKKIVNCHFYNLLHHTEMLLWNQYTYSIAHISESSHEFRVAIYYTFSVQAFCIIMWTKLELE